MLATNKNEVREFVIDLIETKYKSQSGMARAVGIGQSTISKWLNPNNKGPGPTLVWAQLAAALGWTLEECKGFLEGKPPLSLLARELTLYQRKRVLEANGLKLVEN